MPSDALDIETAELPSHIYLRPRTSIVFVEPQRLNIIVQLDNLGNRFGLGVVRHFSVDRPTWRSRWLAGSARRRR